MRFSETVTFECEADGLGKKAHKCGLSAENDVWRIDRVSMAITG